MGKEAQETSPGRGTEQEQGTSVATWYNQENVSYSSISPQKRLGWGSRKGIYHRKQTTIKNITSKWLLVWNKGKLQLLSKWRMSYVSILACFATLNMIITLGRQIYWFQPSSQASRKSMVLQDCWEFKLLYVSLLGKSFNLLSIHGKPGCPHKVMVMDNWLTYMKNILI